jgi:hypothetical protein
MATGNKCYDTFVSGDANESLTCLQLQRSLLARIFIFWNWIQLKALKGQQFLTGRGLDAEIATHQVPLGY